MRLKPVSSAIQILTRINESSLVASLDTILSKIANNNGTDQSAQMRMLVCAFVTLVNEGAQWLSGRVLDSRPRGHGFKPYWRHCVVVLEQDTFI